jgi:glycosyltransferase involved in cell wall biosynthesis
MIDDQRILIMIPAWNEAASIGEVVAEIRGELPEIDVLVIDDGSSDDTALAARQAGAVVVRLPFNLGVGGARRLGFRYAKAHGYQVAVQIDADGQHDPRYVPKLIDGLQEASLVIGARFAGEGDYHAHGPRRWAMRVMSFVLSRMARQRLTDTTSGFRACDRALIELFAEWYPVEYLGDTVETTVRVLRLGYKVRQVPVAMRPRFRGTPSKSPVKALMYLSRAFFSLVLAVTRR